MTGPICAEVAEEGVYIYVWGTLNEVRNTWERELAALHIHVSL